MYYKPLLAILLLTVISLACHKTSHPQGKYTGKLVLTGICDIYTVQVLSGPIDSSLLTKSWYDSVNKNTYTNVFSVSNGCQIAEAGLQQGNTFSFDLGASSEPGCYECMIYGGPTPPTYSAIENVHKIN